MGCNLRIRPLCVALSLLLITCGESPEVTDRAPEAASGSLPTGDTIHPPASAPEDFIPWFTDEAVGRGIAFRHESGHQEAYLMPEIMAGGAALFDADGDGDLDAYCVQSGWLRPRLGEALPGNRLFVNEGQGRFRDASEGSGAADQGYGMGVACGDVDNDGDVDLYVTNVGANALLLNEGAGHFVNSTAAAGVGDLGFGASATFVDLDADGWLDLYVTNYLGWSSDGELSCHNDMGGLDYCDPANYVAPARDVVFRNLGGLGEGVRFEDVTDASGVGAKPGTGLGVVAGDFDDDGLQDIFVANDGMPDRLWMNQGNFTFVDEGLLAGCALDHSGRAKAGMGVAVADVNQDGELDLLVCNLDKQTDSFFLNEGGLFSDQTLGAGLAVPSRTFTRFGVGLLDFNHDGLLDLFQSNGRVRRQSRLWSEDPYAEPNLVLRGLPEARFSPLSSADGTAQPFAGTSRGTAFGDVDGDGALDVLVIDRDGAAQLLMNQAGEQGGWVGFSVVNAEGSPALGATVTLVAGERSLRADVRAGAGYLSSQDPRVHFGLGDVPQVTDVKVRWVDGTEEVFGGFDAGSWHELQFGSALR
ncbi:MAG: CRTAC1 family protein [Planctomycetota bacterium]|nr:CRTAC1 family protein [Planctomycetota bacterium]